MMTVGDLIEGLERGGRYDLHFFWKGPLSQWESKHPFYVDGTVYKTAEHFMMAEKARLFADEEARAAIIASPGPEAAKSLGRSVMNFDAKVWDEKKVDIVFTGNMAKFSQHLDLARILDNTNNSVLIEASPHDCIWGIGLADHHPDARFPWRWPGTNLLGFTLMDVREHLRADGVI